MSIDRIKLILTEEEASEIYKRGQEAVVFFILEQSQKIKELEEEIDFLKSQGAELPSTPSGMIPVFKKPSIKRDPDNKPGQENGHKGIRRGQPKKIDHHQEHTLSVCPKCHGKLAQPVAQRRRYIEDIPEISVEVTEHIINRYYCSHCKKIVAQKVLESLPGSTIGIRALILSAYWHYALGITISHIIEVFNTHLHFPLTAGGLLQMWRRLSCILRSVYSEIGEQIKRKGKLHADETGWRVNGQTHWLWSFSDDQNSYYKIERCRGSPVILEFLGEDYDGVLISDFYSAYNKVKNAERQVCLSHLFRELGSIDKRNKSEQWKYFHSQIKGLLKEGLLLGEKRKGLSEDEFVKQKGLLWDRLDEIIRQDYQDVDCRRLVKRLCRHRNDLFRFLEYLDLPSDNNQAEREIRPAVIMRKNSNGNRSQNKAETQAILMSIFRTLKRRNLSPLETLHEMIKRYIKDNITPSLSLLHSAK